MIVLDTETTNLVKPGVVPLAQQPEIIEFAAVKLHDETLDEIGHLSFLVKPKAPTLSEVVVKTTKITVEMLVDAKPFAYHCPAITRFFSGEQYMCAHNISHDVNCLAIELARLERSYKFPWPWVHYDTVELSMDLAAVRKKSDRLKLSELYGLATEGQEPPKKHRALDDVRTLVTCVRWLRALDGRI